MYVLYYIFLDLAIVREVNVLEPQKDRIHLLRMIDGIMREVDAL